MGANGQRQWIQKGTFFSAMNAGILALLWGGLKMGQWCSLAFFLGCFCHRLLTGSFISSNIRYRPLGKPINSSG